MHAPPCASGAPGEVHSAFPLRSLKMAGLFRVGCAGTWQPLRSTAEWAKQNLQLATPVSVFGEQRAELNRKVWQQRGRQPIVTAQVLSKRQAAALFAPEHSDRIVVGIHEPVFADAAALEQIALQPLVLPPCPRRQNLDHERWRTLHVLLRQDVELIAGHEQEIWLDDVEFRENHVERRQEHQPEVPSVRQMRGNREVQAAEQFLMPPVWRGRHEMLSVDELVPFPVVRK